MKVTYDIDRVDHSSNIQEVYSTLRQALIEEGITVGELIDDQEGRDNSGEMLNYTFEVECVNWQHAIDATKHLEGKFNFGSFETEFSG